MYESSMRQASATRSIGEQRQQLDLQSCQQELMQFDVDIKTGVEEVSTLSGADHRHLALITKAVNDKCLQMSNKLDQFKLIALKTRSRVEREQLQEEASAHKQELERNRAHLRAATLAAMQTMERESRASLFNSDAGVTHRRNVRSGALREEASNVTTSLTALLARMNEQVKQSETTLGTLVQSSDMIHATEAEMGSMGAEVATSGKLLNRYDRRELTDRLLIALALAVFLLTVIYIVHKRTFSHIHLW